ncbi:protein CDV3 homolog [Fopius arisanus]|uniref:Protein CDV3 homolog n=1 Tax=Fopius arisanus TaxID=64838 RepID=A0A9R1U7W6_9HYME|nr:PREDICTED: protein CDV3 homolog [Fopius arisanus]XP_011310587.1 PREDICTED: protein CDV3 homolog [Fopius arisanus]
MADLDDFFAKKDRKKAKGKKFTTTEEIAKKLEETGKKSKTKEKLVAPDEDDRAPPKIEEEEEWREFEEEKKDYSGLKIGNLTVSENQDHESNDERGVGENSSDGESGEASAKLSGPWKKADAVVESLEPTPRPTATAATSLAATGKYKTPHLRHQTSSSSSSSTRSSRMKNIAPDIRSEEYFPTLSAKQPAPLETGAWGRRKRDEGSFEEVRNRGGTRNYAVPEGQNEAPKLSLDNKYGALSQDQS